jgi:acetyltransferase-like isoleucine patch superfamily enzyme
MIAFQMDPAAYFRARGARIGARLELFGGSIHMFGSEPYLVTIGDDVTISHDVSFITHDGGLRAVRDRFPDAYYYAPIVVGDRAFIGARATLLPGATIGARSIVGAGAVVTGTVPPETVVAGVPARPIRSLEEYAAARRQDWIDTSRLTAREKEQILRERLCG